jgi:hypothetical protein
MMYGNGMGINSDLRIVLDVLDFRLSPKQGRGKLRVVPHQTVQGIIFHSLSGFLSLTFSIKVTTFLIRSK